MAEQLTDEMLGAAPSGRSGPETPNLRRLDGPATEPVELPRNRVPALAVGMAVAAVVVALAAIVLRRR